MKKYIGFMVLMTIYFVMSASFCVKASGDNDECYVASYACPEAYYSYVSNNVSKYIQPLYDEKEIESIKVGSPFSFLNNESDVFYFPIIENGKIKYLLRVYPDGDSFSACLSEFLAYELDNLSENTSPNKPLCLQLVGNEIIATVGESQYILFTYPEEMAVYEGSRNSYQEYQVVNIKDDSDIYIDDTQYRFLYKYIPLSITETQSGNSWCTAYCLAAIYRTKTSYTNTSASILMTLVYGHNPSTAYTFPWGSDNGATMSYISSIYGLNPVVLTTTISDAALIQEIDANRPCVVAMTTGTVYHSVVLRGYNNTAGTWSIWNPWFSTYEFYTMGGSYLPTGYPSTYLFTPYMHAYNFG